MKPISSMLFCLSLLFVSPVFSCGETESGMDNSSFCAGIENLSSTDISYQWQRYYFPRLRPGKMMAPKVQSIETGSFSFLCGTELSGLDIEAQFQASLTYDGQKLAEKAARLRQEAVESSERGEAEGQYRLALMLIQDGPQDIMTEEALGLIKKSAEQEYAPAQHCLAEYYDDDYLGGGDKKKALYWYGQAAEQNYGPALFKMGTYHLADGRNETAFFWILKAAQQGHKSAADKVAGMYYYGNGVEKNLSEAWFWIHKGSGYFSDSGENERWLIDKIAAEISAHELNMAQHRLLYDSMKQK